MNLASHNVINRTIMEGKLLPAFAYCYYEGMRPAGFFRQTCPHLPKAFSYTVRTFFVARLPTGLLVHWHDSTHTSGRATGGLFYIKQYGNTPTRRKMSNKDTRALPCYYAITYHPFLRPPFNPLRTAVMYSSNRRLHKAKRE